MAETLFRSHTGDTNLVDLTYLLEDVWGEYLNDAGDIPTELRFTGESLALERGTVTSSEIRADRQITALIATKEEVSGGIEIEWSALSYDSLIQATMFNEWNEVSTTPRGSTGVEVVVRPFVDGAGNRVTDRANFYFRTPQNTEIPTFNLVPGQVFRLTNSNTAQDSRFEGFFQVISRQIDPDTTVTDQSGATLADPQHYILFVCRKVRRVNEDTFSEDFPMPAASGDEPYYNDFQINQDQPDGPQDYSLHGRSISNGALKCSLSIEKHFRDTKDRIAYNGLVVSTMSLALDAESVVTGAWNFIGRGGDVSEAVVAADGERYFGERFVGEPADNEVDTNGMPILGVQHQEFSADLTDQNAKQFGSVMRATTTEITNSGRNVSNIRLYRKNADGTDGEAITGTSNLVMSCNLNLDQGARAKLAIGDKNLIDVGLGQFSLGGDLAIYFTNSSMYQRFLGDGAFAMSFLIGDDAGNAYNFYVPNIKWTQISPNAPSANADVMLEGSFQALKDRAAEGTRSADNAVTAAVLGTGSSLVISQIVAA